jgi:hypothetical protein
MKFPCRKLLAVLVCIISIPLAMAAQSGRIAVHPQDNGAILENPGMGWFFYNYDNNIRTYTVDLAPSDTVPDFQGVTVVYLRLAWSYLEPEEGQYNWSILDTPMQKWVQAGKKVAFRFTTSEGRPEEAGGFATPKWVEKAGAKGHYLQNRKIAPSGPVWEPDFNDPIFLAKLDNFLAAAAEHYDGNPNVAFIDVGFGLWGEGHTVSSTEIPYDVETIRRHIDLYKKHFKKTLLVANDDFAIQGRGLEALGYARDQGLTLRDDSILVQPGDEAYYHAYLSYNFWPILPIILESEHYGASKQRGAWEDGHLFLQAIEDYHASYASVHWYPREFLAANRDLVHRISMRLGYRLELEEISWPDSVPAGGSMDVGYRWRDAGVAPCLPGGHPTVTLEDNKGGITGVFVDEDFDVRELPVGPPERSKSIARRLLSSFPQEDKPLIHFQLPPANILRPGIYSVYISVGDLTGSPEINLPLDKSDKHRRYLVGKITITNQ